MSEGPRRTASGSVRVVMHVELVQVKEDEDSAWRDAYVGHASADLSEVVWDALRAEDIELPFVARVAGAVVRRSLATLRALAMHAHGAGASGGVVAADDVAQAIEAVREVVWEVLQESLRQGAELPDGIVQRTADVVAAHAPDSLWRLAARSANVGSKPRAA